MKIFFSILFFGSMLNAQIGIGTNSPDSSSILDIKSTSKGVLFPRLSTINRNSINNPKDGLVIYNTTKSCLEIYKLSNSIWTCLGLVGQLSYNFTSDVNILSKLNVGVSSSGFVSIPINNVVNNGFSSIMLGVLKGFSGSLNYSVTSNSTTINSFPWNFDGGDSIHFPYKANYLSVPFSSSEAGGIANLIVCVENTNGLKYDNGSTYLRAGKSCLQIKTDYPNSSDGVYWIDIDGCESNFVPKKCYCDMSTDGGGWMLVLNYLHKGGTSPSLRPKTDTLSTYPLISSTTLGVDESTNNLSFAHLTPSSLSTLKSNIGWNSIRFYGKTSGHSRVVHFKTDHANTISYVTTGVGSMTGIQLSFITLNGHSANIPLVANTFEFNAGNFILNNQPFYQWGSYHWIVGNASRWEVDDYPNNSSRDTYHQVWIR